MNFLYNLVIGREYITRNGTRFVAIDTISGAEYRVRVTHSTHHTVPVGHTYSHAEYDTTLDFTAISGALPESVVYEPSLVEAL